jgi:lipopolysaccharide transport system ATP-binding protein
MCSELAVKVENVSKCYQVYEHPKDRLKQFARSQLHNIVGMPPKKYFREFWALRNVTLEIKKGEVVGIIGTNGSGKSTLLQIICGTLRPTSGRLTVNGRVAALLELGSGFNPEFTGRENVYMNASVLGLTKEEIDARFDEIAAFADIGDFIEQPVKTYSSGMMVRLAFAVQAQVQPSILIVDEALAVGDAKFQARCFERLKRLKEGGTSILLVTHSTEQIVTHCSRAMMLDHGSIIEAGNPNRVVNCYLDLLFGKTRKYSEQQEAKNTSTISGEGSSDRLIFDTDAFSTRPGFNSLEHRWGDGAVLITDFHLASGSEAYPSAVITGQKIALVVALRFLKTLRCPIFGIAIKTKEGVTVYGTNSEMLNTAKFISEGCAGDDAIIKAEFVCRLAPGDYFISLGVATRKGDEITPHDRRYDSIHFQVNPETTFFGLVNADLKLYVES